MPSSVKLENIYKQMITKLTLYPFRIDEDFKQYVDRMSAIKKQKKWNWKANKNNEYRKTTEYKNEAQWRDKADKKRTTAVGEWLMRIQKIKNNQNYLSEIPIMLFQSDDILHDTVFVINNYLKYKDVIKNSYLMIDKEKIVGFISVEHIHDTLYIPFIFVKKEYRNRGIASKLLKKVKENADKLGIAIQLYFPKQLTNFYIKNEFQTDDSLKVGIYYKSNKEKNNG